VKPGAVREKAADAPATPLCVLTTVVSDEQVVLVPL
jgi:hypothetical protein